MFFLRMNTPSDSELVNYALHLEQQQQQKENEPNAIDNNLHGGEHSNLSFNFILKYLSILTIASLPVRLYNGVTTDKKIHTEQP